MTLAQPRADAARNRGLLVAAARRAFAAHGPDVPLEEIASAAGVSRTTLHRHFAHREELASAVLEQNVADIEARAADLADADDGAERLFHFLLDVQFEAPWLARVVADGDLTEARGLAARTAAALEPLLLRARSRGLVHPSITTGDVLLALPMAMAVQAASASVEGPARLDVTRAILHRGLFTTPPPGAATGPGTAPGDADQRTASR